MSAKELFDLGAFALKTTVPEGEETEITVLRGEQFGVELRPEDHIEKIELLDGRVRVFIGETVLNFQHDNTKSWLVFSRPDVGK